MTQCDQYQDYVFMGLGLYVEFVLMHSKYVISFLYKVERSELIYLQKIGSPYCQNDLSKYDYLLFISIS